MEPVNSVLTTKMIKEAVQELKTRAYYLNNRCSIEDEDLEEQLWSQ